jgi:uncharacterized protein GlcG (DUF336 family)
MNEQELQRVVTSVLGQVKTNNDMTLDKARRLSEKVRDKAKQMGVNAVVAITNKGARPVLIECMDDSFIASYDVAANKAFTVVSLKMSTIKLKELAQPGGSLYGIQFTNEGKIVIFGGGEPLKATDGSIIGGLGVSGGTEEQDSALAEYGKKIFEKGDF